MKRIPEVERMVDPSEAEAYACADFSEINDLFVERLLEMKPQGGGVRCLDAGSGPADIPRRLLNERPAWQVVGVEASWPMLECARRHATGVSGASAEPCRPLPAPKPDLPGLSLVAGCICRLPFPSESFDVVISNGTLHHLTRPLMFWGEVRRVARPGAVILVRDLARPDTIEGARELVDRYTATESPRLREAYYRSLLAAYTLEEVGQQLESAQLSGLTINLMTDRHIDIYGTL